MRSRKETSPVEAAQYFSRGRRPGEKDRPSADDIIRSLQRSFEEVDEKIEEERRARLAWLRKHPMGDMVVRI